MIKIAIAKRRAIKKKIISKIIPLALILFSMLSPNLTHAGVYDQQQTTENGFAGSIYGSWKHAQSFKPGFNYADFTVQIYVRKEDPADAVSLQDLVMEIREDSAGVPSSTVLMSDNRSASSIGTSYAWGIEWFFLNTGKSLKQDQTYWIVCYQASNGGNSSNRYIWAENVGGNPYARGMAATHNGSSWTSYASDDYTFKTWAEQLALPPAPTLVGPGSTNPATPAIVSANPNLDWNDVTGYYVDWYKLSHERISGGIITVIDNITASNHAPALSSGYDYSWKVAAHNNAGYGSYSSVLYIHTNTAPNAPSNPSPANNATNVNVNADLSWTGGDPDTGDTVTYDVYFGTSTTPPKVTPTPISSTSYDPGTMTANTPYYWYIIATDNHGATARGPASGNWSFTTGSTAVATTLTVDDKTTTVGVSVDLTATLKKTSDSTPISGKSINFWVDLNDDGDVTDPGENLGTATTDGTGKATKPVTPSNRAGDGILVIEANFAGDAGYAASTGFGNLTVNRAATTLTANNADAMQSQIIPLKATLKRADNSNAISGKSINFYVDENNNSTFEPGELKGSANTDASGVASFSYTALSTLGTYKIKAEFTGDANYSNSSDETKTITISKKESTKDVNLAVDENYEPLFSGNTYFYGRTHIDTLDVPNNSTQLDITTPWGTIESNMVMNTGSNNSKTYINPADTTDHYSVTLNDVFAGGSWQDYVVYAGSTLTLYNGYVLKVTDVSDARQAYITMLKDGNIDAQDVFVAGEYIESKIPLEPTRPCGVQSILVEDVMVGREANAVFLKVQWAGGNRAWLTISHTTAPAYWSSNSAGTTPILGTNDGDTVYMIANFSSALAGKTATFNVYEVDKGIEISLEQYDGPLATTTATLDANGKAVASWIADWMQDGWGGLYDPPEYVFIVKVDNTSLESGELQIPNTPQKFIDKAIWSSTANGSTPITTATEGTTIYMYVETRGAVVGEEAIFKIEEKDQWPNPNDDVEIKTTSVANTYGTGKFSVPWVVDWQDDAPFNPPEFIFKVTIDKNSRESAELSVPTGKADSFIDLDAKTTVPTGTVTLRLDLYEKVSLPIVGEWNKGINGKTITWYIDKNKDGDYLDAGENLGTSVTALGLYLDGTATKDFTATGLTAGDYPIKATFAGDSGYKSSEGKATLTVSGDYAAQIISISASDFTVGKKTPITITVKNIGKAADLKIDPDDAPSGWDIDDNQIDFDKDEITVNNVAQGATATFTYYITPPENEDKAYITWRLFKDETWPISDIPLEAVRQAVSAIAGTPISKLISPLDGATVTKPVILDWSNDWESYPSTDPKYINAYALNLSEKYPYGWELVKSGDVQAGVDETTAHSGLKSIKSYIATASTGNEVVWKFKDYVEIIPSTQYTLSVWVKTSGTYSGGGNFKLSFYDKLYGSKVGTDVSLAIPSGDTDWTQYKTTFTSSSTANYIGDLYLDYYNGKGYVWFDDVEIVKGTSVTKKNPETTITSGPEGATPDKDVTLAFTGSDPDGQVTNFSYGIEGPGYTGTFTEVPAITTSVTYNNLSDGNYTFVVRAKDNDLNYDPTPASRMFTVGYTTEPNLVPNPGFESGTTSPTSWVLTTSGNSQGLWDNSVYHSGTRSVKSRLIDNPVEWKATQNITVDPASFYRMSLWVKKSSSAEGKFFMQLEIQDAANASLGTITLPIPIGDTDWIRYVKAIKLPANSDHIASISLKASEGVGILWFDDLSVQKIASTEAISAPVAEITAGPENNSIITTKDVTFKWSGTDSDGTIQGYIYSLDKAISNQDWFPLTTDTIATFSNLSAGKHTFYVTAVDNSGFDDPTPETRTFTINNPPQTTITTGPSGVVSSGNVTFNWTGTDPDTGDTISGYSYRLVGTTTDSGWSVWAVGTTKSYTGLSASYTFYVKAKDSVGAEDPAPATSTFDVNSAPTITTYAPANLTPSVNEGSSLTFSATASDPDGDTLSYYWTVDGAAKSNNSIWTFVPTDDDVGTRNVTLTVSDGRLSVTKTWTVTVNNINNAPVITSYSPAASPAPVALVDYSLVFSVSAYDADNDLLTYDWELDGVTKSTNTSWTYRPTSSETGSHTVTITVNDGLLSATQSWTVTVIESAVVASGTITFDFDSGSAATQWTNLAWTATEDGSITDIKARARTAPTQAGLSSAVWSSYYGDDVTTSSFAISPTNNRWIQVEVFLETADITRTPLLSDLTVSYTSSAVVASGTITFDFDSGRVATQWTNLAWTATEDGSITDIKARARTAPTQAGLSSAVWSSYYGDDVTTSSFAISPTNNRWIQVEVFLETADITRTPLLSDLTVSYTLGNSAPTAPSNPSPANGATGVSINADLSWTGGDPDGDPVTYDVYFGTSATPSLVSSAQSGITYDPGVLTINTTYYWYIVAKDDKGATTRGPASGNWNFTTTIITNNSPVITPAVPDITASKNTAVSIDLTPFETDLEDTPGHSALTWSISGVNTALFTASINTTTDELSITPVTDATGYDLVTLTLADSGGLTDTQDIIVTITGASGTITFAFDAGTAADWTNISWVASSEDGTVRDIKCRLRTAADNAGVPAEWGNWTDYYGENNLTSTFSISPLINRWAQVEAALETTDSLLTPSLDSLNLDYYTTPAMASGIITFTFNAGSVISLTNISWLGTETGTTTDIVLRIRTTQDNGSGAPDTARWSSWSPYYGRNTNVSAYSILPGILPNNQWIQGEAYLMTKDTAISPKLDELTLTYTP